jgi:hypothetical protein
MDIIINPLNIVAAALIGGVAYVLGSRRDVFTYPVLHLKYLAVLAIGLGLLTVGASFFLLNMQGDVVNSVLVAILMNLFAYPIGLFFTGFVEEQLRDILG